MGPGALTPLTGDLVARVIVPAIAESLAMHGWLLRSVPARAFGCRIHHGRVYLDAAALGDPLLRLLDDSAAADLEGDRTAAPRWGPLAALPFLAHIPPLGLRLTRSLFQLETLERDFCAALQRLTQELERQPMSDRETGELWQLLQLRPSDAFRDELLSVPPVGLLAQYCAPGAYAALTHMVTRWSGEPADTAAVLISGLHGMVDVECASALWDLADEARRIPKLARTLSEPPPRMTRLARLSKAAPFRAGLQAFLNRFGHLGAGGVELRRPRWREDPEPLLSVIASYLPLAPDASPHVAEWRQHWEREAALLRVRKRLRFRPLRRFAFERTLSVAQRASVAAANTRFETARLHASLRGAALELGRRIVLAGRMERPDDVFFLLLDELEASEAGDLRERVAERRSQHARDAASEPPHAVDEEGRPLELPVLAPAAATAGSLRGIAASPGQARGRVRIMRDPGASLEPRPGSILVAPCADAAWTPLFAVAGAVVVETGGLLSPASIIARELGIPSVIAVPGATSELREGEEVEVDGSNGTVARIGDAKAASGEAA